jgi:hypothetical protein
MGTRGGSVAAVGFIMPVDFSLNHGHPAEKGFGESAFAGAVGPSQDPILADVNPPAQPVQNPGSADTDGHLIESDERPCFQSVTGRGQLKPVRPPNRQLPKYCIPSCRPTDF